MISEHLEAPNDGDFRPNIEVTLTPPKKWYWHVHHDILVEPLTEPIENRIAFIKKNKLGTVTASPAEENPNSHNPITVWTWTPIKPETERIIAGRAKAVKVAK